MALFVKVVNEMCGVADHTTFNNNSAYIKKHKQ